MSAPAIPNDVHDVLTVAFTPNELRAVITACERAKLNSRWEVQARDVAVATMRYVLLHGSEPPDAHYPEVRTGSLHAGTSSPSYFVECPCGWRSHPTTSASVAALQCSGHRGR